MAAEAKKTTNLWGENNEVADQWPDPRRKAEKQ